MTIAHSTATRGSQDSSHDMHIYMQALTEYVLKIKEHVLINRNRAFLT